MTTERYLFFKNLGYDVDEDYNSYLCESWTQIIKNSKLICQIDNGVPMKHIIEDLCCLHLGTKTTSNSDYTISGPDSPEFKEMLKRVYDFHHNKMMPNGQLFFSL